MNSPTQHHARTRNPATSHGAAERTILIAARSRQRTLVRVLTLIGRLRVDVLALHAPQASPGGTGAIRLSVRMSDRLTCNQLIRKLQTLDDVIDVVESAPNEAHVT
ncbi:ACT domain-containing protein [Jatrophihabitans sp. DSM 45814]